MKRIYVNILGTWTRLVDTATIQNTNAYVWIQENNLHDYSFVNVQLNPNTVEYEVHVSNIVIETVSN